MVFLLLSAIYSLAGLLIRERVNSFVREMEGKARFFAATAWESVYPRRDDFQVHLALSRIVQEEGVVYAAVFDPEGQVIDHSDLRLIGYKENTPWAEKSVRWATAEAAPHEILVQNYKKGKDKFYEVSIPLALAGKRMGGISVGFSDLSIKTALKQVRFRILKIAGLILFAGVFFTFISIGYMVRPIHALAGAADEVSAGRLNVSVRESGNDEVGDLSRTFNHMIKGLREREFMRNTFGKYVNPEVANRVLKGELKLGGEKRDATILFCDIRDFTALSEKMQPEEVVHMLNEYFNDIVEEISEYGGNIDKYIGDAVLAEFGVPLAQEDHAFRAVSAALGLRERLREFNRKSGRELRFGIAIHTGPVVVGNIGSEKKMEYTCIGDTVNTAVRLEAMNKEWRTDIIMSEETYRRVEKSVVAKMKGEVLLRGKTERIRAFYLESMNIS
ncbi:MAG TPA: adenylate/guanylate cyclase domain-containing protein [bacterium]|nr:adenylate/guanylate cyclase domain-containing protein [bacterium]